MTPALINKAQRMYDSRQFTMSEIAASCGVTPMTIYRNIRVRLSRVNAFLNENITGMVTVQLFNRERTMFGEFDRLNSDYLRANLSAASSYAGSRNAWQRHSGCNCNRHGSSATRSATGRTLRGARVVTVARALPWNAEANRRAVTAT